MTSDIRPFPRQRVEGWDGGDAYYEDKSTHYSDHNSTMQIAAKK